MQPQRRAIHTGGCQCGAVRYALYAEPTGPHICHCRMCQKAFGSFFAPFAGVTLEEFAWTRGEPGVFKSSAEVERGFCERCGTPLFYRYLPHNRISMALGSLDNPSRIKPTHQYGMESRMPWLSELHTLAGTRTEDANSPDDLAKFASRQHPDHDTESWPAEKA